MLSGFQGLFFFFYYLFSLPSNLLPNLPEGCDWKGQVFHCHGSGGGDQTRFDLILLLDAELMEVFTPSTILNYPKKQRDPGEDVYDGDRYHDYSLAPFESMSGVVI